MNCSTCKFALPAGATFCPNCGTPAPKNASNPGVAAPPDDSSPGSIPPPPPIYDLPSPYTAPSPNLYAPPLQSQPASPHYVTPQPPYSPVQQVPVSSPLPSVQFSSDVKSLPSMISAEKPATVEHHGEPSHEHKEGHAHTDTPDAHEEHEENANERLILFSDGIIAFAITLAAISIKIPSDPALLASQSDSITLKYITYIFSFVIVAASWNEHHRLFHYIKGNDMMLTLLNFAYLAAIVLVPIGIFFTEVVDANNGASILYAVLIFIGSQLGAGIALLFIWLYASFHRRLVDAEVNQRLITYTTIRMFTQPAVILLLAFVAGSLFLPAGIVIFLALIAALMYRRRYRRGMNTTAGSNDVGRILLFSDAVIGIAITIIAAQIEFPSFAGNTAGEEVQKVFAGSLPLLLSYAIGFVIMGAYWLFHYRMFRYINRHDPWLIILNFCFLLCIVLMFAPINYYAAYSQNTAAGIYFGVWQTLTAFLLVLIWWRAAGKRRLLDNQITDGQIKRFGACLWSNLAIIFVLMFVSAAVGPRTYLFVYLAALGLAMLVIHFIGRRSRSQAVQVA